MTHTILQNQDGWFGEGDEMIFIDGESVPVIDGTGTEDYYDGAWDFGQTFAYLRRTYSGTARASCTYASDLPAFYSRCGGLCPFAPASLAHENGIQPGPWYVSQEKGQRLVTPSRYHQPFALFEPSQ